MNDAVHGNEIQDGEIIDGEVLNNEGEQHAEQNADGEVQQTDETGAEKDEEKSQEEEEASKRKKHSINRRFKQLTDEKKAYAKRAEEAEQENENLRKRISESAQSEHTINPDITKPDIDNFNDIGEYENAMEDWRIKQVEWRMSQAKGDDKVNDRMSIADQTRTDISRMLIATGEERHSDFESVMRSDGLQFSPEMIDTLGELENADGYADAELAADVAYYLGNNPKESERISHLSGANLSRQIGRIAAKIEDGKLELKKSSSPSKTPDPIKPVGGRDSKVRSIYAKNLNIKEYIDMRRSGKIS